MTNYEFRNGLTGECKNCGFSKETHIQGKSGCFPDKENGGFELNEKYKNEIKPLNKMPIKDLKKLQQWAENDIVEYEEFIQQIKEELGRRK